MNNPYLVSCITVCICICTEFTGHQASSEFSFTYNVFFFFENMAREANIGCMIFCSDEVALAIQIKFLI